MATLSDLFESTKTALGVKAFSDAPLTVAELTQLQNINSETISNAQWAFLANATAFGGSVLAASEITEAMLSAGLAAKVNYTAPSKLDATTAPTADWDGVDTAGVGVQFAVGSIVIDQVGDQAYRCVDASTGAAVWITTTLTTDDLGTVATQDASAIAITGGTIDGAAIGGTTPAAGAFTTLSVSGVVAFDTDTLYVNPALDRVGINTSSPIVELQVVNASSNAAISIRSNDASSSILALGDTTNYLAGRIEYDNSSNAMAFFTGSTERVRIDSSGNVGIGTTSPNVELDVNGQIAARAGAKLTISSGAITVTHSFHEIQSETVGADSLDTINGGYDGAILVLRAESGVEEAIILTNSGNIIGPVGSISGDDTVTLMYDATRSAWIVLSRT